MTKPIIVAITLLVGAAPAAALAAPAALSTVSAQTATPVTTIVVRHARSTVHYANGERFDVPNSLLRNRDTLINGLPPEPLQFD